MSRDEIWDDLKAVTKAKFDQDRADALNAAKEADDGGWSKHTEYHWSRTVAGHRLDYWPSRKRYSYRGKTRRGDVQAVLRMYGTAA